ncbi:DUF4240 domain-containing protein [Peribacillus deserti]|uniref:Molybdenum metabolism regulator n=1 Tax=Peribacillus deserti TaxID=673318 RepID=A0A2N5M2F4_9BACI|nr:DUF4240 domain-containing protein [Peribacillus deserti]PLT28531.1 molybdenum metabolism regulator [Peribacillus deserti]
MNEKEFWSLIEKSKEQENQDEQNHWLMEQLTHKIETEIVDFGMIFETFMTQSYDQKLWGAAYVIMGGCSDDLFDYFRGWLIAQGEEIYKGVLNSPEILADYIPQDWHDEELMPDNEEILSVAQDAYTFKKTNSTEYDEAAADHFQEELDHRGASITREIEFEWEDDDDLSKMFPKLWKRFGEEPLEY